MRKTSALIVAAGLLISVSACASGPGQSNCTPTYLPGESSKLVTADGSFGAQTAADFPTPLYAKGPEVSVVKAGDGPALEDGQFAFVEVTAFAGTTGQPVAATSFDKNTPFAVEVGGEASAQNPFGWALDCAKVGSRLAATTTAETVFGKDGVTPGMGVEADDTLVLVIDVVEGYLGKANGADRLPVDGFPAVVLAPNGQPGVTIPGTKAPTDLETAVLKQGSGATVGKDDVVVLNYTLLSWESKSITNSTWDSGKPVVLAIPAAVEGLQKALIGQQVGSQLVVVIPPALGSNSANAPQGAAPDTTLVYVVDILGVR